MSATAHLGRTIAGFAIAPIVPGALIAAALLALNARDDALSVVLANIYFGYPIALLIGVPAHVLLRKRGWTTWFAYLLAGVLLGAFLYVALPEIIEGLMMLQGVDAGGHVTFSLSALPAAMACAGIAALAFWLIVRPDRAAQ